MKYGVKFFYLLLVLFVTGCASTDEGPIRDSVLLNNADQLVAKLQQGGYVIYFRHAMVDWQQRDTDRNNMDNCNTQRALSEKGRTQSRSIGAAIKSLNIPIGIVYASPYCRSIDMAKLAFDDVSVAYDLKALAQAGRQESQRRVNVLKNMLATTPPTGRNTILISHAENISKAAGVKTIEGDAVVFKPLEEDGFKEIAYIKSAQWTEMARALNMQ